MAKKYIEMEDKELVDEWYKIDNVKSDRAYFALGALAGVTGTFAINTIFKLIDVKEGDNIYTIVSVISVILVGAFIFWTLDKNNKDEERKKYINNLLTERNQR